MNNRVYFITSLFPRILAFTAFVYTSALNSRVRLWSARRTGPQSTIASASARFTPATFWMEPGSSLSSLAIGDVSICWREASTVATRTGMPCIPLSAPSAAFRSFRSSMCSSSLLNYLIKMTPSSHPLLSPVLFR